MPIKYYVSFGDGENRNLEDTVSEVGFFGNQNTVAKPTTGK